MNKLTKYNTYIADLIVSDHRFGIKEVQKLEAIKTFHFSPELCNDVVKALESNQPLPPDDIGEIGASEIRQYLDLLYIEDELGRNFAVLVYDSDALEQSPTVIKVMERKQQ